MVDFSANHRKSLRKKDTIWQQSEVRIKIASYILTSMVFVGAILLFGLEPLVGRILIPHFGGAVYVWLTCLMFFQAMLFFGYLYAHFLVKKIGKWHFLILALPLINLPLSINAEITSSLPLIMLIKILFINIALPFSVLSTTAVLAQIWFTQSSINNSLEPYPLYAASNAGSLIALLAYPFIVEPLLGLQTQQLIWTGGYFLYLALVVLAWFAVKPAKGAIATGDGASSVNDSISRPNALNFIKWLLLSSIPSALLLSVTNLLTNEVGSFPMVWVIPLALYLGSFILTFRNDGGVPKLFRHIWLEITLAGILLFLLPKLGFVAFTGHLIVLFILCITVHGELYDQRPHAKYLSSFYVLIALGGWLGGAAISLIAPLIFTGHFEHPIILTLIAILLFSVNSSAFFEFWPRVHIVIGGSRLLVIAALVLPIILGVKANFDTSEKFRLRNYYGIYRIVDDSPTDEAPGGFRRLIHGKTLHGAQFKYQSQRLLPTSYYYKGGAISDVYDIVKSPRKIAVMGLGAGVAAAYAKSNDIFVYYEIDPDNEWIARNWFTYLDDTNAHLSIIVGDGRLALKKIKTKYKYDIIHMDAFSGDGIPSHLLTQEAMDIYLNRLAKEGIILFHLSNRYYDLRPVVKATATVIGLYGAMNTQDKKKKINIYQKPTHCVALARRPEYLQPLVDRGWIKLNGNDGLKELSPWTDDYINILAPLYEKLKNP